MKPSSFKKAATFCSLLNLKFRKVLMSLLASFALSKNKNSEALRPIVGPPRFPVLSFSKCLVCVFCSFSPFLSVLFMFHRKNLVLLHLMNRYTTAKIE